jgi:hypothetical protein
MRTTNLFATVVLGALATACSPYSPDLGPAPFLCGAADQNPRCPSGYTCSTIGSGSGAQEVCIENGGSGVLPDTGNGNCADDRSLEPNENTSTAWITPVDTTKAFPLSSLAICPTGDKDTYSVMITTANENLEAIIEYEAGGADLQGAILNSGGISISNASMTTANTRRAYTPNLPTGIYYVQVSGPASGSTTTNNYKLTINVTGP